MEAPIVGGHTGALPLQGQAARREWRKVSDVPNGQGRLAADVNQSRTHQSGRPRSGNVGPRRSSQNGRMFHPGSSEHSSDSDHHGGDGNGGHLTGGPVSPQEMINQNIGQQDALYDEVSNFSFVTDIIKNSRVVNSFGLDFVTSDGFLFFETYSFADAYALVHFNLFWATGSFAIVYSQG